MRLILLTVLICGGLHAYPLDSVYDQGEMIPGRRVERPIIVQIPGHMNQFELTDSADTYDWCLHKFYPETVHYILPIDHPMELTIVTHGSELKNIAMRVGLIKGIGDTIWTEADNSPKEYINHLMDAGAWDESMVATQPLWHSEYHKPCVLAVEIHGIYTQAEGTSNGLIVTSFMANSAPIPGDPLPVPHALLYGTRSRPHWLNTMPAQGEYDIYRTEEITEAYLNERQGYEPKIFYAFDVADLLDMKFTTTGHGTHLWVWPADSTPGELTVPMPGRHGWPLYCPADKVTSKRMPGGKYMMAAADTTGLSVDTPLWFLLESRPPSSYPELEEYVIYDPEVAGHNYVREYTMLDELASEWTVSTTYCDGLGRPSQTVVADGSPTGGDLVERTDYDTSGRVCRSWLPTVNQGGGEYVRPTALDFSTAYGSDNTPYSSVEFEASPLSRPIVEAGPGDRWAKARRYLSTEYLFNDSSEPALQCLYLTAAATADSPDSAPYIQQGRSLEATAYYKNGTLTVRRITDEDEGVTLEFTNAIGQKVLSRRLIDGTFADTYYVYDIYGNLTVVVPPEAATRLPGTKPLMCGVSEIMDRYCYVYTYDKMKQLTGKKLPGCQWVRYRYDNTGRQYMMQDGELRKQGRWRFTIADALGRECLSGTCSDITFDQYNSGIRAVRHRDTSEDNSMGSPLSLNGYAIQGATIAEPEVLTVTYYDDYSFLQMLPDVELIDPTDHLNIYPDAKGRLTGRVTAAPVNAITDSLMYLASVCYYDHRDRPVFTASQNVLGGADYEITEYDFVGHPVNTILAHFDGSNPDPVVQRVERRYDDFGRELLVNHSINDADPQVLSEKSYDAVGRLLTESVGAAENGIVRTYEYDIRSHPVAISSYGYSQRLTFTYGGNVSSMTWKAYTPSETERTYNYEYDELSRLTAARYSDSNGLSGVFDTSYTYDLNGNITTLKRSGVYDSDAYRTQYGSIDDLTYEYSGNQVTRISDVNLGPFYQGVYHFRDGADEAVEYFYDANGNMTADLNRGITSITYDINNQPRSILFDSGAETDYAYTADGVKLQTVHFTPTVSPAAGTGTVDAEDTEVSHTEYCGALVYEDGELSRINLENGYLSYYDYRGERLEMPEYVFYLRDHLGNNRVTVNSHGGIYQADDYYPFGMTMGCSYRPFHQDWRFGGKEFDRTAGLDLYDFEARAYDPSTARFTTMDPLATDYTQLTPYSYCANNPLINIDPTGKDYNDTISNYSVTLAATFMTYEEYLESAEYSADIINSQNGQWAFQIEEEVDGQKNVVLLPIIFDVSVEVVEPLFGTKNVSGISGHVLGEGRTDTNAYLLATEEEMDKLSANGSYSRRLAQVRQSRSKSTTGAHEMAHGMGAEHKKYGLMTTSDNESRTKNLDSKNIENMIKKPIRNNPGNSNGDIGQGTLINNSRFSRKTLLKGKVVRIKH